MKLHWKSPIIFSVASFLIFFAILFTIFVLTKPTFLSKKDSKGNKKIEYPKTVVYSILFSLIVAVVVLLYRASQEEYNPVKSSVTKDYTKPSPVGISL